MRRCGGQFLEKIRERLFHACGILDFDAGHFQSQNRKTHRHAVIVIGFNLGAVQIFQLGRINRQRIAFFHHFRAALGQLRPQRKNTFAFLHAQAAEVGEFDEFIFERPMDQSCDGNCCHDAVAKIDTS